MKRVLVIQRSIAQYRVDFWNLMKKTLEDNGVELTLLYGKFNNEDALKNDEVDLEWAIFVPNKNYNFGGIELNWQYCLPYLKDKDMVIVEQANRNLMNYLLYVKRIFSTQKLGLWGHGTNLRLDEDDIRNRFKNIFINQSDWWFAYTEKVRNRLIANGFNGDKITCVENAIDTNSLIKCYKELGSNDCQEVKDTLGFNSDHIAIYCGSIYKEKQVDFLIEACDVIKEKLPDFQIIIIGSGSELYKIKEAAISRDWIHYIGNKFGLDRVKYFKVASVYLMPGLVGLGILDSFALQTPLITTDYPHHSPEIEYLDNGNNGIMTIRNIETYAENVINTLTSPDKRQKLINGCSVSAKRYTVENMVHNFSSGIFKCLQIPTKNT